MLPTLNKAAMLPLVFFSSMALCAFAAPAVSEVVHERASNYLIKTLKATAARKNAAK